MASEKAKELAAKQKAEAKAEKLRKKNSDDPRDWGWFKQITQTYKITAQYDTQLPWILLGVGGGTFVVVLVIGFLLKSPLLWGITGVSVSNETSTWPPMRSVVSGPLPVYGTWIISPPAMVANWVPIRCWMVPLPLEP